MRPHNFLKCDAPICSRDPDISKNTWSWLPDEPICGATPYTKIQKVQNKIKKLFLKGKVNGKFYFTSKMLENTKRVAGGIKGRNPDRRYFPKSTTEVSYPLLPRSFQSSKTLLGTM